MAVKFTKPEINVREKLAELDKPSGIAGEAMLRAETPQQQFNLIGAGRRNLIINGGMDVWQRGTSITGSAVTYGPDRFKGYGYASNGVTLSRQVNTSDSFNSPYFTRILSTTNRIWFEQLVEGIKQFSNQTLTLSFWAKSSDSAHLDKVEIRSTGSGYYDTPINTTVSNVWQKFTVTFTVDDHSSRTPADTDYLGLTIVTTNPCTLDIAEVQLEVGKFATPFEHRLVGEELALCQRYFYKSPSSTGYMFTMTGVHATLGEIQYFPPVTMRTTPTVVLNDASPYWEVYPWNTVGNDSIHITSIHSGHMTPDGHGQVGVFFSGTTGSYVTPNLVRGTNYVIQADFISFNADL